MTRDRSTHPAVAAALDADRSDDFAALCLDYLDGRLDAASADALRRHLASDAGKRQAFVLMCHRTSLLFDVMSTGKLAVPHVPASSVARRPPSWSIRRIGTRAAIALAASILVAVGALAVYMLVDPPSAATEAQPASPVATILAADGVTWITEPRYEGDRLAPGPVRIASGRLELLMGSGAAVTIVGPAEFAVASANGLSLDAGALHAFVPVRAAGFTVAAPNDTRIVDLGTEFAMRVEPTGRTQVFVHDGSVAVHSAGAVRRLAAGEGGSVAAAGLIDDDADFTGQLDPVRPALATADRPRYRYLDHGVIPFDRIDRDGDRSDRTGDRLADGVVGADRWDNGQWSAFGDHDNLFPGRPKPAIEFDLGSVALVQSVDIHFGVNQVGLVFAPQRMTIAFSEDGRDFSEPVEFTGFDAGPDSTAPFGAEPRVARAEFDARWTRFVRIEIFNDTRWTLLSEVRFNSGLRLDDRHVLRTVQAIEPGSND